MVVKKRFQIKIKKSFHPKKFFFKTFKNSNFFAFQKRLENCKNLNTFEHKKHTHNQKKEFIILKLEKFIPRNQFKDSFLKGFRLIVVLLFCYFSSIYIYILKLQKYKKKIRKTSLTT